MNKKHKYNQDISIVKNVNITTFPSNCYEESIVAWDYAAQSFLVRKFVFRWKGKVIKISSDSFLLENVKEYEMLLSGDNK